MKAIIASAMVCFFLFLLVGCGDLDRQDELYKTSDFNIQSEPVADNTPQRVPITVSPAYKNAYKFEVLVYRLDENGKDYTALEDEQTQEAKKGFLGFRKSFYKSSFILELPPLRPGVYEIDIAVYYSKSSLSIPNITLPQEILVKKSKDYDDKFIVRIPSDVAVGEVVRLTTERVEIPKSYIVWYFDEEKFAEGEFSLISFEDLNPHRVKAILFDDFGPYSPVEISSAKADKDRIVLKGEKGDTGPQGPQGEKGDPGAVGPQGATGATGATGAKGDPGQPGKDGKDGPQGPIGPVGPTGPTGPAGNGGVVDYGKVAEIATEVATKAAQKVIDSKIAYLESIEKKAEADAYAAKCSADEAEAAKLAAEAAQKAAEDASVLADINAQNAADAWVLARDQAVLAKKSADAAKASADSAKAAYESAKKEADVAKAAQAAALASQNAAKVYADNASSDAYKAEVSANASLLAQQASEKIQAAIDAKDLEISKKLIEIEKLKLAAESAVQAADAAKIVAEKYAQDAKASKEQTAVFATASEAAKLRSEDVLSEIQSIQKQIDADKASIELSKARMEELLTAVQAAQSEAEADRIAAQNAAKAAQAAQVAAEAAQRAAETARVLAEQAAAKAETARIAAEAAAAKCATCTTCPVVNPPVNPPVDNPVIQPGLKNIILSLLNPDDLMNMTISKKVGDFVDIGFFTEGPFNRLVIGRANNGSIVGPGVGITIDSGAGILEYAGVLPVNGSTVFASSSGQQVFIEVVNNLPNVERRQVATLRLKVKRAGEQKLAFPSVDNILVTSTLYKITPLLPMPTVKIIAQ